MACKIKLKGQNQNMVSYIDFFDKESSDHDKDKGEQVIENVEDNPTLHKEYGEQEHTNEDIYIKRNKCQKSPINVIDDLQDGWAASARNTIQNGRIDPISNDADIEELAEELAVLFDKEITKINGIESKQKFVAVSCRESYGQRKGIVYKFSDMIVEK